MRCHDKSYTTLGTAIEWRHRIKLELIVLYPYSMKDNTDTYQLGCIVTRCSIATQYMQRYSYNNTTYSFTWRHRTVITYTCSRTTRDYTSLSSLGVYINFTRWVVTNCRVCFTLTFNCITCSVRDVDFRGTVNKQSNKTSVCITVNTLNINETSITIGNRK